MRNPEIRDLIDRHFQELEQNLGKLVQKPRAKQKKLTLAEFNRLVAANYRKKKSTDLCTSLRN